MIKELESIDELDLSNNKLTKLNYLPPKLKSLNLSKNLYIFLD